VLLPRTGVGAVRRLASESDQPSSWFCRWSLSRSRRADPRIPHALWGWGSNTHGQVGDGKYGVPRLTPFLVETDTRWIDVDAGTDDTVGVRIDGGLWANGQFGDGTTTSRTTPHQVGTDTGWDIVTAGQSHSFAGRAA